MIRVGSSFVTVGGGFVEYSGPIVPPEPPVDNYFQLTNRGSSEATLYVTSGSNGQVFINDEFMGKFTANAQRSFTVPAGAIVKITGLSPRGNSWDYGTLNSNSSSNNFSIDRFDNSISNPDYMFCRFNGLKSITSWTGAENYTVLHDTFAMSTGLATLPASWNGLGNVTQLIGTFNSCGLTSIPSSYAGLGKLTRASHAFAVGAEGTVAKMTTGGDSGLETLSDLTWSEGMFYGQSLWTGNAKAVYDYLSTKTITVTKYDNTFTNCTSSTGYMEIPESWGGGLSYNPLHLPAYTIRLKYNSDVTPTFNKGTATQVSTSPNVWDLTYSNNDWERVLENHSDLIEILGANTSNVTSLNHTFANCSNLTSIQVFDTGKVTNMWYAFKGCSSLTAVPLFDTSNVTKFSYVFSDCSSITSFPKFNTHKVTEMGGAFHNCSSITTVPLFDTSNVESMSGTFWSCTSLTSVPLFDTSNVKYFASLFCGCSALTEVPLFDTKNATDMYMMLDGCVGLTSVPLFDTHNVTNFGVMLYGCTGLTTVPLFDTSKATKMDWMLRRCTSLTSIPLFDTSNVTTMSFMCEGCTNVETGALALYNQASTQSIPPTSYSGAFSDCGISTQTGHAELEEIPITWGGLLNYNPLNLPAYTIRLKYTDAVTPTFSKGTASQVSSSPNVWDLTYENNDWQELLSGHSNLMEVLGANTANVTSMYYLFRNCTKLASIALFDTSKVTTMFGFIGCSYGNTNNALTTVPRFSTHNVTNMGQAFIYCSALRSVPQFDTRKVNSMNFTFAYCTSLTSVPLFNTTSVTQMSGMFSECTSLTTVPLFDTSNVVNMSSMLMHTAITECPSFNTSNVGNMMSLFEKCNRLRNVPLFDTSKVYNMSQMFMQCTALKAVPFFNTSNVTNMSNMLYGTAIESVPLFDTSKVTNMSGMFMNCDCLETIPLFNTSNVTNMMSMCRYCTALKAVPLFDTSKVTNMSYMLEDSTYVESGALALYKQASGQSNPPTTYNNAFAYCGVYTQTGIAELRQIPLTWGGSMEHYLQFTNFGSNMCKLAIYSTTSGMAYVDDKYATNVTASTTTATVVEIPAGSVLKLSGLTPKNDANRPLFADVNGYTGELSLDRFDETIQNYEFAFSSWVVPFTSLKRISSWAGAAGVTAFRDTFNSAGLTSIPSSWVGLDNLTTMWGTFNGCANLTAIPDSWAGLTNVTSLYCTFSDLSSLQTGGSSGFGALSNVTNMWYTFRGCTQWTGDAKGLYDYLSTKSITVTDHTNTFLSCANTVGYYQIPSSWGGGAY